MDRARWDRMLSLFHRAVELPRPEQSPFIEAECADDPSLIPEVLAMLEEDARSGSLLDRDVGQIAGQFLGQEGALSGNQFGPYRLLRVLGEGGMGVVYLAERSDLGNRVAIKILRDGWLSPARRERFINEQRTLAQLNHPSIARLYDANTLSDGTPWFVMECVDGVPLTEFCQQHECSIDERLKLFRAVCEAVEYAHSHGVIHRDLKPSNILVKDDGSVRLLDFGIAKQMETGGKPVDQTRTGTHLMTPAYAAPEQIRGESTGVLTDVYSLGVILYELLAGKLPFDISQKTPAEAANTITTQEPEKPSSIARHDRTRTASWTDLDILCLTAMHKDPKRRYASAGALVRDVNHYLADEPLEARPDSWSYTAGKFFRRNWPAVSVAIAMVALITAAIALTLRLSLRAPPSAPKAKTVAVLPFQNEVIDDQSRDLLQLALADEVARTLGYARSVSVRPSELTRKYIGPNLDLQKAGRELGVDTIVTGHFLRAGEQLQVRLEALDVESNRLLWRDVFDVPAQNMMAMQAQIAAKTRGGLAPLLGISEFVTATPPRPKNEEAYNLYLRAKAMRADPRTSRETIQLLERSVALDPSYGPAWEQLSSWSLDDAWFGNGGEVAIKRWRNAARRAIALDPDNVVSQADNLYGAALIGSREEKGSISRGAAYREMEDLVRRRPDIARLHFLGSWLLRDAGLLEESARECDISLLIDAQDAGARSCAVTFMFRGEYQRALDYLHLDRGSAFEKTISIDVLLRQGKEKDALEAQPRSVPQWGGYEMLLAFLEHRPASEIATLARTVQPSFDPESNYFSAAHLAWCGQPDAALAMLKQAIQGGYCSYPAMDSDPMLASIRGKPEFAVIRSAGIACQKDFMAQRARPLQ